MILERVYTVQEKTYFTGALYDLKWVYWVIIKFCKGMNPLQNYFIYISVSYPIPLLVRILVVVEIAGEEEGDTSGSSG